MILAGGTAKLSGWDSGQAAAPQRERDQSKRLPHATGRYVQAPSSTSSGLDHGQPATGVTGHRPRYPEGPGKIPEPHDGLGPERVPDPGPATVTRDPARIA